MLSDLRFSTDYTQLLEQLRHTTRLLLIQDLDGVCMGLVRDPRTRALAPDYVRAARALQGEFYVLTNGEHIGSRGVNRLVEQALGEHMTPDSYLPGLGAGGVQWQEADGTVVHPGVSAQELAFLEAVPRRLRQLLTPLLSQPPFALDPARLQHLLEMTILDNPVSPTLNINGFTGDLDHDWQRMLALQKAVKQLMKQLLAEAAAAGLDDSFFLHVAPNLGQGPDGERVKWASDDDLGTTDFQFMLNGAVKEVGVLVILNRYYHRLTGHYPLGENFNAREAPRDHQRLLELARRHFDPALMPRILGVGDTVTSQPDPTHRHRQLRGGSDRGFLTLVQALGQAFDSDNAVLFVDSSGGELKRPAIDPHRLRDSTQCWQAVWGITDADDPLRLNAVFPKGHPQYVSFFCQLAEVRRQR
ncbi:MAG: glucosylglycerol 3-phosphatase [Pseudomonadales bacterium]|nr:glucosylglycerol 3-phosphatase [Pseudomonadales bacterium]